MKTVYEMAKEAGDEDWGLFVDFMPELERFAELVRADEREACAKVCSEMYLEGDMNTGLAADLIRARSQS